MATTTNLLVTKIETSQGQKEVTANAAFDSFDKALTGVLNKTITTANVTLTDSEAQNYIVQLSGTLTGNRDLIVPTRPKPYIIYNNTSGAFTVTVKTSAGSGVVITQGAREFIYCDSVNVVRTGEGGVTVKEVDGTPLVNNVTTIRVTNATLVDDGGGQVTITTGGGGGGATDTSEGTFASRPAAGNASDLYLANDSLILSRDNGSTWTHRAIATPLLTPPPAVASLTWVNQGSATAVDAGGGIVATTPLATGTNIRILVETAPATPYTLTVGFVPPAAFSTNSSEAFRTGIGWRSSGDAKITYVALGSDAANFRVNVYTATNPTTGFSSVATCGLLGYGVLAWLRIEDDGTNRKVHLSNDGINWFQIYSVARTTFHTPDQIGLFFDSNHASFPNISTYYHYKKA